MRLPDRLRGPVEILPVLLAIAWLGAGGCRGVASGSTGLIAAPSPAPGARVSPAQAGPTFPAAQPSPSPAPVRLTTAGGKPIRVGLLCDRTGNTANVGTPFCDAVIDAFTWVNETGGIRGRPIEVIEDDHVADVPTAFDLWGRFVRRENVSLYLVFGQTAAPALAGEAGRARATTQVFGFGPSSVADGSRHPTVFDGAACPRCQALALLDAIGRDWRDRGAGRSARLIYVHDGTPLSLDPLGTVTDHAGAFGLELAGSLPIDPRASDLRPRIAGLRDAGIDYALVNLISKPAGLLIDATRELGLGIQLYAFPWATSQDEFRTGIEAIHYRGLQITALATDNPPAVVNLKASWAARNVPVARWLGHVFYDRGLAAGLLAVEALRQAENPDDPAAIARAYEGLRDFTAGGYLPPVTFTQADHAGTRLVRLTEIGDERLVPLGDWFAGPPPPGYPKIGPVGW